MQRKVLLLRSSREVPAGVVKGGGLLGEGFCGERAKSQEQWKVKSWGGLRVRGAMSLVIDFLILTLPAWHAIPEQEA